MFDRAKSIMIGFFVLSAVAITGFILLFIHPKAGDEGKILRVRFANIDKVNKGTRVTFGGMPVGEVIEIKGIIDDKNPRRGRDGNVYVYELKLAVDSSVEVYNTDDISLRTSGLLGEKSVNIMPVAPRKGEKLIAVDKEILYANEGGSVEETFKEFKELSDKFDKTLDDLMASLQEIKKNDMWAKISGTFKNLEEITESLNKKEEWSKMLHDFSDFSSSLNKSWETVSETIHNVNDITKEAKAVVRQVEEGRGTIGKIVMSDDLYLRISSLFGKAETTLNDVNHYGLLFHLDKNWQRLRARRANLMQKLSSPQQFRNYFNDEVDQISTSLSRVYMVLNKRGGSACCPDLVRDYEFTKVFSELLRRVEGVEEQLVMYNSELQEYNVHKTEL